jgi:hypothetical protein
MAYDPDELQKTHYQFRLLPFFGTHSPRRTKATLIYRRTGNLRAVQLLLVTGRSRAQFAISASR